MPIINVPTSEDQNVEKQSLLNWQDRKEMTSNNTSLSHVMLN